MRFLLMAPFLGLTSLAEAAKLTSDDFAIEIDDHTGALLEVVDAKSDNQMSYISGPKNAPWQPTGSHWGLGYANLGEDFVSRAYWDRPDVHQVNNQSIKALYEVGPLEIEVTRSLGKNQSFTETYKFRNTGSEELNLSEKSETAFVVYTPFNDHYVNTNDSLNSRTHAHVWAHGGVSSWVKLNQMGGRGRNLGLVLTQGALVGYSIESRDTIKSSNTRGVFLVHPDLPTLKPEEEATLEWTLFWHEGWDDFFKQCESRSDQFVHFNASSFTLLPDEEVEVGISGAGINSDTTVNDSPIDCNDDGCSYTLKPDEPGELELKVTAKSDGKNHTSYAYFNAIPSYDDLLEARAKFIVEKQQYSNEDSNWNNAYILYDNQMEKMVTFDTASDRNPGRERVGMGVFLARWLKKHPDADIEASLIKWYEWLCTELQDEEGYVLNSPGDRTKRLYNWPWVMTLHIVMSELDLDLPDTISDKKPLERFMMTTESFYREGGKELYSIQTPILEALRVLERAGDEEKPKRTQELFTEHAQNIADRGTNYPPFEVNFEQSIVGPAANILLEMYRFTKEEKWLDAAEEQVEMLRRFSGKQPDYRLHEVAIRHWDGYWFGKDRLWGDTMPHHWSAISALALHHWGKATEDEEVLADSNRSIEATLALFTPEGEGSAAWMYPSSVDGRHGHYADPYANDQDWALAHLLQMEDDDEFDEE